MSGGQDSVDEAHEIEVVPAAPAAPRTGLMLGGAVAVLVIAVVGAFFAANAGDDETEVDVAAPDAEVVEDDAGEGEAEDTEAEEADDATEDASSDAAEATEAEADDEMVEEAMAVDFAGDMAIGFGGPNNIVHTADGFVSIGWGPDGLAVSRSADGLEWASTPISGLPEEANLVGLAEYSGGYVAVMEIWPAYEDEEMDMPMFGHPESPSRMLATSADLENWTTSELPDVAVEEGGFSHIAGMATSGDTIAIHVQVEPAYVDETQVLFEAGLLTEADMETFCGTRIDGPNDPIIVMSCDWEAQEALWMEFEQKMEAADTDEERMALEEEYFGGEVEPGSEEMFRLEPGDPTHTAIMEGFNMEPEMTEPVVLSGQIGGEFTQSTLPVVGYANSIAGTDAGFLSVVHDWQNGNTVVLRSTDGATWTEGTSIGSELDVQGLVASGDMIVATGQRWNSENSSVAVWTTSDLGSTWAEADLATELYGAYGMPIAGPAGVAVSLDGTTEPYPENFGGPELLLVESDGYQLELNFPDDLLTLRDADGTVVHEVPGVVNGEPEDIEGVVRFDETSFDVVVTFLDPATGEDLVAFGNDDFEAAYESSFEPEFDESYEEPPRRTELWFSTDGVTWDLLEALDTDWESNSWTSLAGVGDDEVLVRTETWTEPPAELWAFEEEGRDPTDEEIAALESWEMEGLANNVEWRRIEVG
jgi:hypothetical protein